MNSIRTIKIFINLRRDENLTNKLETIFRYLYVKVIKYIGVSRILSMRGRRDIKFLMYPGCTISEKMYVVGMYDYDGMMSILKLINKDDVFFDIGANVGPFSLLAGKIGASVVSFEGHPKTLERLKDNLKLNEMNTSGAINMIVSSNLGSMYFTNDVGSAENKVSVSKNSSNIEVPCISIDSYCNTNMYPTFVKIDTEGHELEVIKGMKNVLKEVKYISFEANGLSERKDLAEIYSLLNKNGFTVGNIDWSTKQFYALSDLGDKSKTGDYHAVSTALIDILLKKENFKLVQV